MECGWHLKNNFEPVLALETQSLCGNHSPSSTAKTQSTIRTSFLLFFLHCGGSLVLLKNIPTILTGSNRAIGVSVPVALRSL